MEWRAVAAPAAGMAVTTATVSTAPRAVRPCRTRRARLRRTASRAPVAEGDIAPHLITEGKDTDAGVAGALLPRLDPATCAAPAEAAVRRRDRGLRPNTQPPSDY